MGHLLRPHECGLCTHDIVKLIGLLAAVGRWIRSTFLPKEPSTEISGYDKEILIGMYALSRFVKVRRCSVVTVILNKYITSLYGVHFFRLKYGSCLVRLPSKPVSD